MIKEKSIGSLNGILVLVVTLVVGVPAVLFLIITGAKTKAIISIIAGIVLAFVLILILAGLFMIQPNTAAALTLFGDYVGTVTTAGLRWANPFYSKERISLRVRNFESEKMKVNDLSGSPIEIAAIVVWRVADSAEALFAVDNYQSFVRTQSEAAIRQMATSYPYDVAEEDEKNVMSLRADASSITEHLKSEIQARLADAGVEVIETRISHLAYAPEIASAMLQRQQAGAVIAARQRIVEGAVGMVNMALEKLQEDEVVDLDEERKAAMVSNLLVVLCGDKSAQPVLNSGSLYT